MRSKTIETLEMLRREKWFRNVGVHDTDAAAILTSWQEAIESCSSPEWEELCTEAANQYRARLQERSAGVLENWNEIVKIVKPASQSLVREMTHEVIKEHDLPKVFLDTVDWDILHLCMESEFADIYPAGFYASQAYWYSKGHFPCGWQGAFPQGGRLVVY
jgi:hypothetical protein